MRACVRARARVRACVRVCACVCVHARTCVHTCVFQPRERPSVGCRERLIVQTCSYRLSVPALAALIITLDCFN